MPREFLYWSGPVCFDYLTPSANLAPEAAQSPGPKCSEIITRTLSCRAGEEGETSVQDDFLSLIRPGMALEGLAAPLRIW